MKNYTYLFLFFIFYGVPFFAQNNENSQNELLDDFQMLLQKETSEIKNALNEAESIFENLAQKRGSWTNYKKALNLILKNRSKAAIPMLINTIVNRKLPNGHIVGREIHNVLTILTGQQLEAQHLKSLANWWDTNKTLLFVDYEKMSEGQLHIVVKALLSGKSSAGIYYQDSPETIQGFISSTRRVDYYQRNSFTVESVVHPLMIPALLKQIETTNRWVAINCLSELLKQGKANEELAKLLKNRNLSSFKQFAIYLARWKIGEDLETKKLIELYQNEQNLALRMALLITLGHSKHSDAIEVVLFALKDRNKNIRKSAVFAAKTQKSKAAVPLIEELLLQDCSYPAANPFISALGSIKTYESKQALAHIMALALENNSQDRIFSSLVRAFSSATGKRFTKAGAHREEYYKSCTIEALKWWESEGAKREEQIKRNKPVEIEVPKKRSNAEKRIPIRFPKVSQEAEKSAHQHYNSGVKASNKKEYLLAIEHFSQAIEINPNHTNAYIQRGGIFKKRGELEKALSDYNIAIELNPNYDRLYNMRGFVYYEKENWNAALIDFTRAIELSPSNSTFWQSRGMVLGRKGDLKQAIIELNHAIKIKPKIVSWYVTRGILNWEQNLFTQAKEDFKKALRMNSEYSYTAFRVLLPRYYNQPLVMVMRNWEEKRNLIEDEELKSLISKIFYEAPHSGSSGSLVWYGLVGKGANLESAVLHGKIKAVQQCSSEAFAQNPKLKEKQVKIYLFLLENYLDYCEENYLINTPYNADKRTIGISVAVRKQRLLRDIHDKFK